MPTVTKGTNSYVSEAEATAYFGNRLHSETWTGAVEADRQKALLTACRMLDGRIAWKHVKAEAGQSLEWPRLGFPDIEADTVPQAVQDAQCELALLLLGSDLAALPETGGFSRIKVDTVEMDIDRADRPKPIPDTVFALVSHLGGRRGNLGSVSVNR